MIAHGAFFPRLVCDPDVGWGPNGDRTATRLMLLISLAHGLAPPPPPPLAVFAVIVLALVGSFFLGLRLGSNRFVIVLAARRMDAAESITHTIVGTDWGPGGSTVADAGCSQLEIVTKSRAELPFPGKGGDGKMTVQYLDPETADKTTLVGWCRSFGLPVSGTKPVLKDRLRAFSASPDKWSSLSGTTRRMHRGPQMGRTSKTASKKQSTRRAKEIFSHLQPPQPHLPFALPTIAPPQSAQQREYILKWAADVSRTYPYLNKEERLKAAHQRLTRSAAGMSSSNVLPQLEHTNTRLDQLMESLTCGRRTAVTLDAIVGGTTNTSSNGSTAIHAHNPIPAPPPPPLPPAPSPSPLLSPCRTLTFHNGVVLEFMEEDIPTPPAVSFAENLALLNQMWDDTPPYWQGNSVLAIRGVPIPIVYWKNIYSRLHGKWKGLKSNWSLWKMIVARWCLGSEADFWKEFSDDDGNRMTYTGVVKTLKANRVELDENVAAVAKKEYGSQFKEIFVYKKNGALHVKTKPSEIAKQYRALRDLYEGESDD